MVGRIIKNYEVRAMLAEGDMGAVYLAENTLRDRSAVLKLPRGPLVSDYAIVERFLADATVARALGHPNVAEVIDVGRLSDGKPYLLTELLDGETLGARLHKVGRLPAAEAVRIVGEVAAALAVAHDKSLVHGDLKPENVFLALDSSGERVKLLDFGVAVLHGQLGSGKAAGAFAGTPAYMAPEQCHDEGGPVDHRADIYALGALLYHMVCGMPPFVHASPMDVFVMHVLAKPVPPRQHVPDLPPQLEAVILRALAKKPADRFASMGQLREALGFGQQLVLRTPTPVLLPAEITARLPVPPRSSPVLRVGLSLLALAVIGGGLFLAVTRQDGKSAVSKTNTRPADAAPAATPLVVVRLDASEPDPGGPAVVHFQEAAARAAAAELGARPAEPTPPAPAPQVTAKTEETTAKPVVAAPAEVKKAEPTIEPETVADVEKPARPAKGSRRSGKQSAQRPHPARGRLATPAGPRRQPTAPASASRQNAKERKRAGKWVEKW
jgi:serine/threonine protein kinase